MVRLYFVCMGNHYRSRLAEELALHYAAKYGVEIEVDSGGLLWIYDSSGMHSMARETLNYLAQKEIVPRSVRRNPKGCDWKAIEIADIVVLTDDVEQRHLFVTEFPKHEAKLIGWDAHDRQYDPELRTLGLIDIKTEALIKSLI